MCQGSGGEGRGTAGLSCLPQAAHACRKPYQPVLGGRPPRPLVAALTCRVLVEGCCWGQCGYPGRPPQISLLLLSRGPWGWAGTARLTSGSSGPGHGPGHTVTTGDPRFLPLPCASVSLARKEGCGGPSPMG